LWCVETNIKLKSRQSRTKFFALENGKLSGSQYSNEFYHKLEQI